jgi:hydroxyacylglutathione hydrolase
MILTQHYLACLSHASYVIGDETTGRAVVVDPRRDVGVYLDEAAARGLAIERVIETHIHADFLSGHLELAEQTGAVISYGDGAVVEFPMEPLHDGQRLSLGDVTLEILATPGHTPESICVVVYEHAGDEAPNAVLTGDTLFVGDIARPDLAVDREVGAHGIYASLNEKLLTLPPACEVWPGHLGGSLCGGPGMDMKVSSTIAYELAHNDMLAETDEERFVARAIGSLAPQPPNFRAIVALNRGPLRDSRVSVAALTPRQVDAKQHDGALVVDVRTDLQFDDAHIPGAICNPAIRAGFGTKLAWVADREHEVLLVGRDDEDALRAAHLAAAVGITNIGGCLDGGMTSWREEKRPTERVERIDVAELHERIGELQVLDVRARSEWEDGHLPGAAHVPYHDLHAIPDAIDPDAPIAVICSSGQRSAVAASLLLRFGARRVIHVADGGVGTWRGRNWPIEQSARDSGAG